MTGKTLYDKVWDAHVVHAEGPDTMLLYIDRHLVHEVTSPQAFEGLQIAGRQPWRIDSMLAVADHNVPTTSRANGIDDPVARLQVDTLDKNCDHYKITEFKMADLRQGIVHVIGPEQGATLPGMTVVCGDSHTSTHGAFGALAFGIGTSEVEHVMATVVRIDASTIEPQVSWGTSPEMVTSVVSHVPDPALVDDEAKSEGMQRALEYMDLEPLTPISDIKLDRIFIGSCTNSRIEDLRAAADVVKDRKVADSIKQALIVPGSGLVKQQAEEEGLDEIFLNAGFEWREPGCSMCLAMNADKLGEGERCASTSNRNFEGRQGKGGRTHLVSPAMAAAAAIAGHFVDVRNF
ncbi:UNVERIFIED_CONTAM: hypothetical protein GTU68_035999 [Idotea baltica]|nr:hypothetical protein [Idotea baltica]